MERPNKGAPANESRSLVNAAIVLYKTGSDYAQEASLPIENASGKSDLLEIASEICPP